MTLKTLRTVFLAALITGSCFAAKLEVDLVVESVLKHNLENGAVAGRERQAAIKQLFQKVGCSVEEQSVNKNSGNVICTLPGQTNSTIVAGGHFDFVDRGKGIVDDWSGVSLLPSLYQALKSRPRTHTYVFVAFAAEEQGLVGSSKYVKKLTAEQRGLIRAFVNLDCIGLNPVKVWLNRSTPALVARLDQVARAIDITVQAVNVDRVGDDTHPFLTAKVPVISLHSITQDTLRILHSPADSVDAIHFDEYCSAYKLAAYYLAYLDVKTE